MKTNGTSAVTYLTVSMKALGEKQRIIINRVNRKDENGKALLGDLTSIVELRNVHAENAKRDVLAGGPD